MRGHGLRLGAYGSVSERELPSGSRGSAVSEPPSGMLTRVSVFTAQPLASRIGPRLRWRSLSHAISIDGQLIASTIATTPTGIHGPISVNAPRNVASAAVRPLTATPSAATMPTSNFGFSFGGPPVAAAAPAAVAPACSRSLAACSAAAARLATVSSIQRSSFLYGDQNAWPMLIGLSMILAIVAFQSRPLRSKNRPLRPTNRLSLSPAVNAHATVAFSPPGRVQSTYAR